MPIGLTQVASLQANMIKNAQGQRRPHTEVEAEQRKRKFAAELAALRQQALADLEARGYDVRGKTTSQIRRALLKRGRPKKPCPGATGSTFTR